MLPAVGTRVSLRYRLPAGASPPLTDVVGFLVDVHPLIRVRTKTGAVVDVSPLDVVAVRTLTDAPVRTSAIRNLEHAAALGWPGVEHRWHDGWFLRFGHGSTRRANSAVPLDVSASADTAPIIEWYAARGAPALLAAPDRLYRVPAGVAADGENLVMVASASTGSPATQVEIRPTPDDRWHELHPRRVPVDVLTAVVDGDLAFATIDGAAVGRAALTSAPDGTRWVGLSAVHVAEAARRSGHARTLCAALLAWGAERGATRAYVQVLTDNVGATRLYESMGFGVHHRSRYVSLG